MEGIKPNNYSKDQNSSSNQLSLFTNVLIKQIEPIDALPPSTIEIEPGNNANDNSPSWLLTVMVPIATVFIAFIVILTAYRVVKFNHFKSKRSITDCEYAYEKEPLRPVRLVEGLDSEMQILQASDKKSNNTRGEVSCDEVKLEKKLTEEIPSSATAQKMNNSTIIAQKMKPSINEEHNSAIERPKTLKFLAASVAFQYSTVAAVKRLPYTPDPDCTLSVLSGPVTLAADGESTPTANGETEDKLTPLPKPKFIKRKMKPRNLLERRGSNVALTITLRSNEKLSATNGIAPLHTKSPKPLTYLQGATSLLSSEELHEKSCDTVKLQQEFWEIPMNHPSEKTFNVPGHGTKNRYRTILPNEHSRVQLDCTDADDPLTGYINANYIRDYELSASHTNDAENVEKEEREISAPVTRNNAAFIATQGPMANTIGDFWRMVWQEKAKSIIMITKLKERKEKCAQYLPVEVDDVSTYDRNIKVRVAGLRKFEHFTVRQLEVTRDSETRRLRHFWYTTWMDHEAPEKTRGLLELVQEVSLWDKPDHGPAIVHCSAGIGRTGCYIAVTFGCRQLMKTGKTDILRMVSHMRLDRGGMIQTWEQYQFVHQALSRYARILAGENVTTPSTTASIRSPPDCKSIKGHSKVNVPRPSTPKHRRSLSESNLPSPKEMKFNLRHGVASNKNNFFTACTVSNKDHVSDADEHSARFHFSYTNHTGMVKSSSSPTIYSPVTRLCLQSEVMNLSSLSPISRKTLKSPDATDTDKDGLVIKNVRSPKNGLDIPFLNSIVNKGSAASSPAKISEPTQFSFDLPVLNLTHSENAVECQSPLPVNSEVLQNSKTDVQASRSKTSFFFPSTEET